MCTAASHCHKVTLGNDTMPQWVLFHLIKYTAHCISIIPFRDQILSSQRGVNVSLWINFWLHTKDNLFANERDRKSSIKTMVSLPSNFGSTVPLCFHMLKESNSKRLWTRCVTDPTIWANFATITQGLFGPSALLAHGAGFGWTPAGSGADAHLAQEGKFAW